MKQVTLIVLILFCSNTSFAAEKINCMSEYKKYKKSHESALSKFTESEKKGLEALSEHERKLQATLNNCNTNGLLLALMAETQITLGENLKAVTYGRLAVTFSPDAWVANWALGNALTLVAEYKEGLQYLEKASKLQPSNINLKFGLCSNYEMARQYRKAIKTCTSVASESTGNTKNASIYVRARAYSAIGEHKKAKLDYDFAKNAGYEGAKYYSLEHLEGGKFE
jgi:tetratricopeptide (TPR) repeat protein